MKTILQFVCVSLASLFVLPFITIGVMFKAAYIGFEFGSYNCEKWFDNISVKGGADDV